MKSYNFPKTFLKITYHYSSKRKLILETTLCHIKTSSFSQKQNRMKIKRDKNERKKATDDDNDSADNNNFDPKCTKI